MQSFFQNYKTVEGMPLATDAAGRSSDIVALKGVTRVAILVSITQGSATPVLITPRQALDATGTGSKVIQTVPIWANLDTLASDAMSRVADAANYTTDAAIKNKLIGFEFDVSQLDCDNGFDYISVTTGASNVANLTGVLFFLGNQYRMAVLPTAIL